MSAPRILVTGSRAWTDVHLIRSALSAAAHELGPDAVLVHGDCPTGADRLCRDVWLGEGRPDEAHPADWNTHGRRAGFVRNAEMVKLGADICLAFIVADSRGATMTAGLAEKAGLRTLRFELDSAAYSHCFPQLNVHTMPHRGCILR